MSLAKFGSFGIQEAPRLLLFLLIDNSIPRYTRLSFHRSHCVCGIHRCWLLAVLFFPLHSWRVVLSSFMHRWWKPERRRNERNERKNKVYDWKILCANIRLGVWDGRVFIIIFRRRYVFRPSPQRYSTYVIESTIFSTWIRISN